MPDANQHVSLHKGRSLIIKFGPIVDPDALNKLADLSGHTARWWMGKTAEATGANVFLQKSTSGGGVQINPAVNGGYTIDVTINPADTANIPVNKPPNLYWYHECVVANSAGSEWNVGYGRFILLPSLVPV